MFLLGQWSLMAAAVGYLGLGVWRFTISRGSERPLFLIAAFIGMALWAGSLLSGNIAIASAGEGVRDLGWLAYILSVVRSSPGDSKENNRTFLLVFSLLSLSFMKIVFALVTWSSILHFYAHDVFAFSSFAFGWFLSICGLVLAHHLYRRTEDLAGSGFRLILLIMSVVWAYDINFYTVTLLGYAAAKYVAAARGLIAFVLIPSFAVAARRKERWRLTLSRNAATQSLLFLAMGTYLVVISMATQAIAWLGNAGDVINVILVVSLSGMASILLLSSRLRAKIKVLVVKNLFQHRYDYRTEWLRFSHTIGDRHAGGVSDAELAVKSIADVTESRSGALFSLSQGENLELAGTWNEQYPHGWPAAFRVDPQWIQYLEESGRIIDFEVLRAGIGDRGENELVPGELLGIDQAWVAVPLVRSGVLIGLAVLSPPDFVRELDWEDFDLLRVVGQQVAMHLADIQSRAELEEARRFEEFNRRFAFIIHDIKNVVSQLSLLSSNVPEHGGNPKFQAAMADTIANATSKMTNLLSRLSSGPAISGITLGAVDLGDLLQRVVAARRGQHPIKFEHTKECQAVADDEQLTLALDHLIQNAIEASARDCPVTLSLNVLGDEAEIRIEDRGVGMSPQFLRSELFKPFVSTKSGGFGIGAAEAKALIVSMGGTLTVTSIEGSGSSFSIRLPLVSVSADT